MADFTVDWEYWLAPDGSFVYISPSCEAITAYSPGEFIADPSLLAKIVYPDDTPLYSDHISRVHSFADWGNLDFRIVKRDGEIRWVSHTCMPVNGEDGTYLGQRASNRDITGRKQAEEAQLKNAEELRAANEQMTASEEELRQNLDDLGRSERALRESENSFRTIIHSMLFGIVIIDAKTHTILEANQKALDMIGGNWDIVSGSVCHRFICPAECGRCPVTDLGQTVDSSERFLLTMSGEKIPIFKTVVKTTLAGREVLIESFIDITGRDTGEPGKGARFEMTVPKGAWRNAGNGA
jgi:PAS domain S-box-containing protein